MADKGRPTTYSEKITEEICRRIMEGESLRTITLDEHMPTRSTVHLWLSVNKEFSDHYARARDLQGDTYADEIVSIADQATDRDSAAAAKVKVDARKWVASKLKPKKYGDKLDLDAHVDGNISVNIIDFKNTPEQG